MLPDGKSRQALVVIGPGRSGTSLLMQVLQGLGARFSDQMTEPSHNNRNGYFEDKDIVLLHKQLAVSVGFSFNFPISRQVFSHPETRIFQKKLCGIIRHNVELDDSLWAVKDPRISHLMPIWNNAFTTCHTVPLYILAVRSPSAVLASSLAIAPDRDPQLLELRMLHRLVDSLRYSVGRCFIVHYEDWFSSPETLVEQLYEYAGLSLVDANRSLSEIASSIVDKALNRSGSVEQPVTNRYLKKLYEALQYCRGASWDYDALSPLLFECIEAMQEFSPWATEASSNFAKARDLSAKSHLNKNLAGTRDSSSSILVSSNDIMKIMHSLRDAISIKNTSGGTQNMKITNDFKSYEQQNTELSKNIAKVSGENERYCKQIESDAKQITELKNALAQCEQRVAEISEKLVKANGEIHVHANAASKAKEEVKLLALQEKTYMQNIILLEQDLRKSSAESSLLRIKIDEMKTENLNITKNNNKNRTQLQNKVDSLVKSQESLKETIRKKNKRIRVLQRKSNEKDSNN